MRSLLPRRRRALNVLALGLATLTVAANVTGAMPFDDTQRGAHDHKALLGDFSQEVPQESVHDAPCVNGYALDLWECSGVDLLSFTPTSTLMDNQYNNRGSSKIEISDSWGWVSPATGDRYVIAGKSNGAAFFRVNDPVNPEYLGDLSNPAPQFSVWHDIKVFADHAFVVAEAEAHGLQVFDLTRLDGVTEAQVWSTDTDYLLQAPDAHNIAINEESARAYILGGTVGGVGCGTGVQIVDISDPKLPVLAGCHAQDAYVHDAQCVTYHGPDSEHQGREICVLAAATTDTVSVVDMTNPAATVVLSQTSYDKPGYVHQGWFTEDQRFFLLGDEGDEGSNKPTRTMIFDMADLDAVPTGAIYAHDTEAIDHNLYTLNGLVYQANYSEGLVVLDSAGLYDASTPLEESLEKIAWFDVFPDHDNSGFVGAWSNYPYFGDGLVAISAYDGLYLVRLHDDVLAHEFDPRER